MSWLHNLSIRTKAFAAPIILLLCLAGLGLKSCTTLGDGAAGLVTLTESDLVKKKLVEDVTSLTVFSQFKLFRYVSWLSNGIEEATLQALEREIVADSAAASDSLKTLMQRGDLSGQASASLETIEKTWEKYRQVAKSTIEMGAVQAGMAVMMFGEADELFKSVSSEFQSIADGLTRRTESFATSLSQTAVRDQRVILFGIVGAFLISIPVTVLVALSIARPVQDVTRIMGEISSGNLAVEAGYADRHDEIGRMVEAIEVFRTHAVEMRAMEQANRQAEIRRAAERKAEMTNLAVSFEAAVGHVVDSVVTSAKELEGAATVLKDTANESSRIAVSAVRQACETDQHMGKLSQAASRIGSVLKLISAIAEQTNLLALNATIEAARAGDAGRGFAVVAAEVKALAGQTAKATEEIGHHISGIQAATEESVAAIKQVDMTIGRISEITTSISGDTREGGTVHAAGAADHAGQPTPGSARTAELDRPALETGSAADQVLSAARLLLDEGNILRTELQRFLATIRAA